MSSSPFRITKDLIKDSKLATDIITVLWTKLLRVIYGLVTRIPMAHPHDDRESNRPTQLFGFP